MRNRTLSPIRISENEQNIIEKKAALAGTTLSEYVRTICMEGEIKSRNDNALYVEILKLKGDLARLGNLFKLAVKSDTFVDKTLLNNINQTINEINVKIKTIQ